jgi:DME family drug/metabolite transporter
MVIGLGIGDTLYFRSMELIGVSRALPISGTYPLPTMLLAAVLLGEPAGWRHVAGTVLVVAAVYLISAAPVGRVKESAATQGDVTRGIVLAVLASLLWAASTVLLKSGVGSTNLIVANSLRLPAAGLVLLVAALRQPGGLRIRGAGALTLSIVVLSGIVGTALGSALYLTSVIYAGAAKAAALQSVSPFFAAPLALIFLHERVHLATVFGTVLSVAGVWLLIGM